MRISDWILIAEYPPSKKGLSALLFVGRKAVICA